MSHMQPQITEKMRGWKVETRDAGTCFVPEDVQGVPEYLVTGKVIDAHDLVFAAIAEFLKDYVEGRVIESVEVVNMYFARLSAPGYLDCTEWCGFNTLKEAREYLRDL